MGGLLSRVASAGQDLLSTGAQTASSLAGPSLGEGEVGNAAVAGMLPGVGGMLPGLDQLGGLLPQLPIPRLPIPEFPMPGMPQLPNLQLPNLQLPALQLPDLGIADGLRSMGQLWDEEGLAMLTDPRGARDRSRARDELSSRFQVVDDDFAGPRFGHQVTGDEYEAIVRQFSDIRLGRSDLKLDTAGLSEADAAGFRSGAMNDIADILQTPSGRELIGSLADGPGWGPFGIFNTPTTISRHNDGAGNADASNALGGGRFGRSGFARYVPGVDTAPGSANIRSDVTLYHELVHARDAVYNTWDSNPVTAASGGSPLDVAMGIPEAEHRSVGLGLHTNASVSENRYRAERAQIGLSGFGERHHGSETDDNMSRRTTYAGFVPGGTPATMPAPPGTPVPGLTPP